MSGKHFHSVRFSNQQKEPYETNLQLPKAIDERYIVNYISEPLRLKNAYNSGRILVVDNKQYREFLNLCSSVAQLLHRHNITCLTDIFVFPLLAYRFEELERILADWENDFAQFCTFFHALSITTSKQMKWIDDLIGQRQLKRFGDRRRSTFHGYSRVGRGEKNTKGHPILSTATKQAFKNKLKLEEFMMTYG